MLHRTGVHENCQHDPGYFELSCATKCSEDHLASVALQSEAVANVAKELWKMDSPGERREPYFSCTIMEESDPPTHQTSHSFFSS